jgi:hypothetical protein
VKRIEQGLRSFLAQASSLIRRLAAGFGFDAIERADAVERLLCDGRAVGLVAIEELAPHMRPAGRLDDALLFEDGVEAGIAVGMQRAFEALQMCLRMFALAVWRVEVRSCRRTAITARPSVAYIGP